MYWKNNWEQERQPDGEEITHKQRMLKKAQIYWRAKQVAERTAVYQKKIWGCGNQ